MLALQNRISYEDNQPFIGRQVKILVEAPASEPASTKNTATATTCRTHRSRSTSTARCNW